jgi:glycosyltransferase involved in cell wall biosynthesis
VDIASHLHAPSDLPAAGSSDPRVSILIPALNEARNIPHVFSRLPDDVFEVVLVDGGSVDETVEVARSLRPHVRVVQQDGRGKGNAIACGLAACEGEIVVMLDADGSTDAAEIPRFVEALKSGADFAKGSRFMSGGGSSDITALRRTGNRVLCTLVNLLYGTRYTDLCYGFNAFWRSSLQRVHIDCDGFEVESLLSVRASKLGLATIEVPSYESCRIHGESNLRTLPDGCQVLKTILRERFKRTDPSVSVSVSAPGQPSRPS